MPKLTISRVSLWAGLLGLVTWSVALAWISSAFAHGRGVLDKPVLSFVALQAGAGIVYLLTLALLRRRPTTRGLILMIIATGLLMRLAQFAAVPVLEDDFYRYLWDGAVTAHAQSPYLHAPEQVQQRAAAVPDELLALAESSGPVIHRINHPWLSTIYPPTAQVAFAVAHWVRPFDIQGLRFVWLALDFAALALLWRLLRERVSLPFTLAIYWLNPLLVKEVFNAGHMELVLVVPLLATLAAVRHGRAKTGGAMLGLAAGAKLWPVIWLPMMWRAIAPPWHRRIGLLVAFSILTALLALPVIAGRLDAQSGFTAYAQRWQMNDSAYLLVHELAKLISTDHAHTLARLSVAAVLLGIIGLCLRHMRAGFEGMVGGVTAVTVALFLLSPTQFPWYYLWVLPLMTLRPLWSVLALTVTLPMYYLRFPLDAMGHVRWFDYGLVWLEFVPIWLMLAWELWRLRRRPVGREQEEALPCIAVNASPS